MATRMRVQAGDDDGGMAVDVHARGDNAWAVEIVEAAMGHWPPTFRLSPIIPERAIVAVSDPDSGSQAAFTMDVRPMRSGDGFALELLIPAMWDAWGRGEGAIQRFETYESGQSIPISLVETSLEITADGETTHLHVAPSDGWWHVTATARDGAKADYRWHVVDQANPTFVLEENITTPGRQLVTLAMDGVIGEDELERADASDGVGPRTERGRAEWEGMTRRIAEKIWRALRYGEDVIERID